MFETISKGFRQARNRLAGLTELSAENIEPALREVRLSLLEADVELGVAKAFLARVKEKSVGLTLETRVKKDGVQHEVGAAERFIKLHPNHPNVDYAYYLRGLANFNDDLGLLGSYTGQDMSERDPKAAREAFNAFKDLVTRFPDSKYAPDSVLRLNYLVNMLAQNEVHVARYYMKRGAFVAAANRVQYSLKTYPQATANEEGLLLLVQAYDKLGMTDLRNDAERVLKTNFPKSKYLSGKFDSGKPWWQLWNW